jgi:hypothetical protein
VRRALTFKKTDVTRATKAVLASGMEIARIEINKDGVIIVVPKKPVNPVDAAADSNEWDGAV